MRKPRKSYVLSPENAEWITSLAAFETIKSGRRVSASQIVNDFLTEKREHSERMPRNLNELVNQIRKGKKVVA